MAAATKKEEEPLATTEEKMEEDIKKEDDEIIGEASGKEGGIRERPIRKALPKAIVKRRNNARVKKMAVPKAPHQVLNELVGANNVACKIMPAPGVGFNGQRLLTAQITVMEETFTGCGPTKNIAKNIAAEAAVHKIVMNRFENKGDINPNFKFQENVPWGALASMALFKLLNDWQSNGYEIPTQLCSQDLDMKGLNEAGPKNFNKMGFPPKMMGPNMDFTDESGAFHAFQSQGLSPIAANALPHMVGPGGPMMRSTHPFMGPRMPNMGMHNMGMSNMGMPNMSMPNMGMSSQGPGMQHSTDMAMTKHPVSMLMEKKGKEEVTFEPSEESTDRGNLYVSDCKVDGKTYTGKAKSKKEAKRQAAIHALADLYDIKMI